MIVQLLKLFWIFFTNLFLFTLSYYLGQSHLLPASFLPLLFIFTYI